MIEIKAFEEDREVPVPYYTARVLAEVLSERSYQNKTWGTAFDDKNTLNDWVAYAVIYLGQAARMKAPPDEQRKGILKAATLLVGGIEAFDRNNNSFAPRHYDPENPGMTVAADPSRGRTRAWQRPKGPARGGSSAPEAGGVQGPLHQALPPAHVLPPQLLLHPQACRQEAGGERLRPDVGERLVLRLLHRGHTEAPGHRQAVPGQALEEVGAGADGGRPGDMLP
jgi:hypothetical protein